MKESLLERRKISITTGLVAVTSVVLIRNAWVGDDAYITFRTIDNLINGYGLTWNVAERVQSFTHPLWLLLHALAYFFTREIYYTTTVISLILTLTKMWLYIRRGASEMSVAILGVLIILGSKPFFDFTASGLENPLTHLLIVLFYVIFFSGRRDNSTLLSLSLIASLATLNRMDTVLLILPSYLYYFYQVRSLKSVGIALIGFSPFVLWELFAIVYYGFPFPNTAYAKLNTGIASRDILEQGYQYLKNCWYWSPSTIATMASAAILGIGQRSWRLFVSVAGMLLYLLYVMKIGGGYMSGRFFTAPFVLSVMILSQLKYERFRPFHRAILSCLVILGIVWPYSPVKTGPEFGTGDERLRWDHGIADQRAAWFQQDGLLNQQADSLTPNNVWAKQGLELRESGSSVVRMAGIGHQGFFAGPDVYIVDNHALTDPFLYKLPTISPLSWRVGHYTRDIPEGYLESLEAGENMIVDSSLSKLYDAVLLITKGDLFELKRFKAIWKMNTWGYDYLLQQYLSQPQKVDYTEFNVVKAEGTVYNCKGCIVLGETGLSVSFDTLVNMDQIEISVDHNDDYLLEFRYGADLIGSVEIDKHWIDGGGLRVDTIEVPDSAVLAGFDRIVITPQNKSQLSSVGHLRLLRKLD